MAFIKETGYSLPAADEPLTHARILHGNNRIAATNVDAGTTAVASSTYSKSAPLNGLTYERWKPNATTSTYEIDLGSAQAVTMACVGAHTLGSSGCTVTLQYEDSGWQTVLSDSPAANTAIMALFGEITAQNWRLSITGTAAPEIGVFWVGNPLQMERAVYGGFSPIQGNRNTVVRGIKSQTGEWLGRARIRRNYRGSISWAHLTADWVRDNLLDRDEMVPALETQPFFLAWRPDTFPLETFLCWTNGPVQAPANMGVRDLMTFGLEFEAFADD